jgi:hypothetical protein
MKGFASIIIAGLALAMLFAGAGWILRTGPVDMQMRGDVLALGAGTDGAANCTSPERAASGGDYMLVMTTWQARGAAQGGGYQLLDPGATMLRGSGCCCAYLPLTTRGFP